MLGIFSTNLFILEIFPEIDFLWKVLDNAIFQKLIFFGNFFHKMIFLWEFFHELIFCGKLEKKKKKCIFFNFQRKQIVV